MRTLHALTVTCLVLSAVPVETYAWAPSGNPLPAGMSVDPTYGRTPKKPIRVGQGLGAFVEQAYLNALRGPRGEAVTYERVGGGCCMFATPNNPFGKGLLDRYAVTYAGLAAPIVLYIDMYDWERPLVPVGLTRAGTRFMPLPATEVFRGCGCWLTELDDPSGREGAVLLSTSFDGSAHIASTEGVIGLLGKRSDEQCRPKRVGGKCTLEYRGEKVVVTAKMKAMSACTTDDTSKSCAMVRVVGELTGRFGTFEQTLDVQGECGC